MRNFVMLLALASLSACQSGPDAVTYDGAAATDQAAVAHGERLSRILGCKSCHGPDLQGGNVTPDDPIGDMWASNVTLRVANYDDAALDRLIRKGDTADGRKLIFMPIESFQYVSDADAKALIAYLRTVKPEGKEQPPVRTGPLWDEMIRTGEGGPAKDVAARFREEQPVDLGKDHRLGRYITMTVCTECHNDKLQGYADFSPDLDIAGTYNEAELERLLTTGEGKVKKDLGLMTQTAQHRFSHFTPHERQEVARYLLARANGGK